VQDIVKKVHPEVWLLTAENRRHMPAGASAPSGEDSIVFFGSSHQDVFPAAIQYVPLNEEVVVGALHWPPRLLRAMLAREMGHRLRHLERLAQGDKAKALTAEQQAEENVEMCVVSQKILDAETHGQLRKRLQILAHGQGVKSPYQAASLLTDWQMQELEALVFRGTPLSHELRSKTMGKAWLFWAGYLQIEGDSSVPPKEKLAKEAKFYIDLTEALTWK